MKAQDCSCCGMAQAINAPEQNFMEDIWLQGKSFVRKNFTKLKNFLDVKKHFQEHLQTAQFNFEKLFLYGKFIQMI